MTKRHLSRSLADRGFAAEGAHVLVHGVPVVLEATVHDYDGLPVRVDTAEHLVATAWSAPATKQLQGAAALLDAPAYDRDRLRSILERHGIPDRTPRLRQFRLRQSRTCAAAVAAKSAWHAREAARSPAEKVAILLRLQREILPILHSRRSLEPRERPWEIEP